MNKTAKRTRLRVLACAQAALLIVLTLGTVPLVAQMAKQSPYTTPVPRAYFGLSVMRDRTHPPFDYGTTRTWDAWPRPDWAQSNPAPGVYDFSNLDKFFSVNNNLQKDIIYTLGRTPHWASSRPDEAHGGIPGECAPPAHLKDWDDYLRAVVTHAAGRIKYWEVWNEPNLPQYYCGDVATLVELTKHARTIIKSIDPSAMILSPSATNEFGVPYMGSFLAQGGAAAIDVVAFHGYRNQKAEDILSLVAHYQAVMAANKVANLPLWDTEANNKMAQSTDEESAFLAKYFILQWWKGVARFVWYAYDGDPQWGRLFDPYKNQPLPVSDAYVQVYKWMVGSTLQKPCSQDGSGTWSCFFVRNGRQSEVVWNSTQTTSTPVNPSFVQYEDLRGDMHHIDGGSVTVGNLPILLSVR